jgi:prepilin-type N-terminal cleavage/methylation domain-containing protein
MRGIIGRSPGQPHSASGFSLVEVMMVVMLIGILGGMAVPISTSFINRAKADSSVESTLAAVRVARDRAIAERRNVELTFISPNRIRLERQNVDANGVMVDKTTLSEVVLENGQQFVKFATVPDTPDLFGASSATTFGGTPPFMFTSDGSMVDSNGDVINGSIFVGVPDEVETARAVTVFGVSGLTRTWKWRGARWFD